MKYYNYTIIIPHHNIPTLLLRCLNSIPSRNDIQIIVIDDNSDSKIVNFDNFPGSDRDNVEIFFTKEGKGAGYARNIGLKHVKGKWLLFADADDFFTSDAFEILDAYLNSDADMILFRALSVESETLKPANRNERINKLIDLYKKNKISAKDVSLGVQVPWCRMIRYSLVNSTKIMFDEISCSNDTMFTTKIGCLAQNILVANQYLYVITFRNGSLWSNRYTQKGNYFTRLNTQIRRNKYVEEFGYKKTPILGFVISALKINFSTFIKAVYISCLHGALFDGISSYYDSIITSIYKKKE